MEDNNDVCGVHDEIAKEGQTAVSEKNLKIFKIGNLNISQYRSFGFFKSVKNIGIFKGCNISGRMGTRNPIFGFPNSAKK